MAWNRSSPVSAIPVLRLTLWIIHIAGDALVAAIGVKHYLPGLVDVIGFLSLGDYSPRTSRETSSSSRLIMWTGRSRRARSTSIRPGVCGGSLGFVALMFRSIRKTSRIPPHSLLVWHAFLLAAFLGIGVWLGLFNNVDSGPAVFAGMLGVSAMAKQNALVRLVLPGSPTTAVVTTNTTRLTIDLATLVRKRAGPEELAKARKGASAILPAVLGFIISCASGSLLYTRLGFSALALPLILAILAIPLGEFWSDGFNGALRVD